MWNIDEKSKNFIINLIEEYIKEKNRFPTVEKLIEKYPEYEFIISILKWEPLKTEYQNLIKEMFIEKISKETKVKMKELVRLAYEDDKEKFEKFFELNLNKENINSDEFQNIGKEIKTILEEQENILVWNVEKGNSKYATFSSSIADKYRKYIKLFFPYYDNIWVKVRYVQL